MTPKEKAKELVNKYYGYYTVHMSIAKKCALIAVDEILKAVDDPDETFLCKDGVDYWMQVKQEIEKL